MLNNVRKVGTVRLVVFMEPNDRK